MSKPTYKQYKGQEVKAVHLHIPKELYERLETARVQIGTAKYESPPTMSALMLRCMDSGLVKIEGDQSRKRAR